MARLYCAHPDHPGSDEDAERWCQTYHSTKGHDPMTTPIRCRVVTAAGTVRCTRTEGHGDAHEWDDEGPGIFLCGHSVPTYMHNWTEPWCPACTR